MKELKLYQCEICNTQYNTRKFAEDCEKSHKHIVKVDCAKYRGMNSNKEGYPDSVTIEFDDGEKIKYHR